MVKSNQLIDRDIVFCEGEVGNRLYIMIHGEVKMEFCKLPGSKNSFGEIALVGNNPRAVIVTTYDSYTNMSYILLL